MSSSTSPVLRGVGASRVKSFTPGPLTDLPTTPVESGEPASAGVEVTYPVADQNPLTETVEAAQGPAAVAKGSDRLHFDQVYADQMALLREQAHTEGFAAGHAEGMAAAEQAVAEIVEQARAQAEAEQAAWRAQASSAVAALVAAAAGFEARTAPALEEMTTSLTDAAYRLVEDVLGREVAATAGPVRDAVDRALRLVPADSPAIVRLHPSDHAALDPAWVATLPSTVTLVPDAGVEAAGAVVEAGARRVDAQLSTALERVREVLAP